jgi:4-hydroxybenzoate polyprenyltransferase
MHPHLRAWAQLVRVPNTLTSCADVLAGFVLAVGIEWQLESVGSSLLVISLASICLYWAGMVLNDVHDIEEDKALRRNGPLVRGFIAVRTARIAGWGLLLAGMVLAIVSACLLPGSIENRPYWLVGANAVFLAILIVAYDSSLKATAIGPLLMGLCRGFNMLLGVSLGACLNVSADSSLTFPVTGLLDWPSICLATVGHVGFVTGITLAARREGLFNQSSFRLGMSWGVSLLGVASIAACSVWSTGRVLQLDPSFWFPLFIAMLAMPWLRRAIVSIRSPGTGTLVPAIKQAILSIIFLDAAIAFQFGGLLPGMLICGLALPTFALSRIFRVT